MSQKYQNLVTLQIPSHWGLDFSHLAAIQNDYLDEEKKYLLVYQYMLTTAPVMHWNFEAANDFDLDDCLNSRSVYLYCHHLIHP